MNFEMNDDYQLWERFKKGDREAFYHLYDSYVDVLYGFGKQFSKDSEFVKDCIHDLFLDLHKYRKKLGRTDSIKLYLLKSLRRKIQFGKIKHEFVGMDDTFESMPLFQATTHEQTIIESENKEFKSEKLSQAVNKLTDQQQAILYLKFEQDLPYDEIANILDISVESARTSVYRIIKTLRKSLKEDRVSLNLFILHVRDNLIFKNISF
ncbi:RNA polymerase sigma factor [Sunxiuqinia sp. A32]|uniref:RNA polymerase sigma factor n=1 Tax=Sunxiuqinia sp. A32 TaxID=3461496 RepID=UPI004045BB93